MLNKNINTTLYNTR